MSGSESRYGSGRSCRSWRLPVDPVGCDCRPEVDKPVCVPDRTGRLVALICKGNKVFKDNGWVEAPKGKK
jgi:hypothetical protein